MEDELFTITVNLAGNRFPLTIRKEDEIFYRDAAKFVKGKIDSYRERHSQLPYESVLMMVAYHFAVESEKQKHQENVGPVVEKMELLDKELDKYLKGLS
jgi:cell division protein ZapA